MNDRITEPGAIRLWCCYASAGGGVLVWSLAWWIFQPDWAASLLLLGPLVVVPLGLALLDGDDQQGQVSVTSKVTILAQMIAALFLVAAFAVPAPGLLAAALTLPWVAFTFWIAALGAMRLAQHRSAPLEDLCPNLGMLFLAVGGLWAIASRFGARPLGFEEPLILLTAAHFHFAGFALPLLTGSAGRALPGWPARIAAVGVMAGVPLVALGITVGSRLPLVEAVAAWELTGACVLVAVLQGRLAARPYPLPSRILFGVSGGSLLAGMALATVYALGKLLRQDWLDIPTMVRWHASMNALGFALPGLLGWIIARRSEERLTSAAVVWRLLGQRPLLESWESRAVGAGIEAGPRAGDACDRHERVVAQEISGPPEADGPFRELERAIRSYEIFPLAMLEPMVRQGPVQVGDTVGGCYHLFPGVDLVFASRVIAVFDERVGETWRAGFTYRTLQGHPERGEETFSVEKDEATGRISVALRSWSRPGAWLTWLAYPYARHCQVRAGRAALDHLEALVKKREGVQVLP